MKFLQEVDSFYFQIGLGIVFIVGNIIILRKKDLKLTLQYWFYSYGIVMLLLAISIPHVFQGFPEDLADLKNNKRLLYHLQKNNEVLLQTTEAMRTMAFITFIFITFVITKVVNNLKFENPTK